MTLRNKETKKQKTKTYIGQTSTDFKQRLSTHKHSFKYPDKDQTSLSKYIWEQKSDENWIVTWKIVDRGKNSPLLVDLASCVLKSHSTSFLNQKWPNWTKEAKSSQLAPIKRQPCYLKSKEVERESHQGISVLSL